jgi:hypothetical protein
VQGERPGVRDDRWGPPIEEKIKRRRKEGEREGVRGLRPAGLVQLGCLTLFLFKNYSIFCFDF